MMAFVFLFFSLFLSMEAAIVFFQFDSSSPSSCLNKHTRWWWWWWWEKIRYGFLGDFSSLHTLLLSWYLMQTHCVSQLFFWWWMTKIILSVMFIFCSKIHSIQYLWLCLWIHSNLMVYWIIFIIIIIIMFSVFIIISMNSYKVLYFRLF